MSIVAPTMHASCGYNPNCISETCMSKIYASCSVCRLRVQSQTPSMDNSKRPLAEAFNSPKVMQRDLPRASRGSIQLA